MTYDLSDLNCSPFLDNRYGTPKPPAEPRGTTSTDVDVSKPGWSSYLRLSMRTLYWLRRLSITQWIDYPLRHHNGYCNKSTTTIELLIFFVTIFLCKLQPSHWPNTEPVAFSSIVNREFISTLQYPRWTRHFPENRVSAIRPKTRKMVGCDRYTIAEVGYTFSRPEYTTYSSCLLVERSCRFHGMWGKLANKINGNS